MLAEDRASSSPYSPLIWNYSPSYLNILTLKST